MESVYFQASPVLWDPVPTPYFMRSNHHTVHAGTPYKVGINGVVDSSMRFGGARDAECGEQIVPPFRVNVLQRDHWWVLLEEAHIYHGFQSYTGGLASECSHPVSA